MNILAYVIHGLKFEQSRSREIAIIICEAIYDASSLANRKGTIVIERIPSVDAATARRVAPAAA